MTTIMLIEIIVPMIVIIMVDQTTYTIDSNTTANDTAAAAVFVLVVSCAASDLDYKDADDYNMSEKTQPCLSLTNVDYIVY